MIDKFISLIFKKNRAIGFIIGGIVLIAYVYS